MKCSSELISGNDCKFCDPQCKFYISNQGRETALSSEHTNCNLSQRWKCRSVEEYAIMFVIRHITITPYLLLKMVCFRNYSFCSVCVIYFVNICVPSVFHTDDVFAINVFFQKTAMYLFVWQKKRNKLQNIVSSYNFSTKASVYFNCRIKQNTKNAYINRCPIRQA